MSGKLDQSLDEILSTQRRSNRGGKRVRGGRTGKATPTVAPVGGVKKTTKPARGATNKAIPTGPSGGSGDSKIVVSNLPKDVNESQIKEYFVKSVGPIKRVDISYGPGGVSRGIATIVFVRADGATKALGSLNGLLVDNRPMKIEVVVDAAKAASIPPPKGLSERIAQPKSQPKSAAAAPKTDSTRGKGRKPRGGKAPRSARPAKKTAEELDSEMADYFDNGATAPAADAGAAPTSSVAPAASGDVGMDDEIM